MLCNKEEFQIELSLKIVLCQICLSHRSASFPLLSACCLVEFDSSVNGHLLLRLISIARYAFKIYLKISTNLLSREKP